MAAGRGGLGRQPRPRPTATAPASGSAAPARRWLRFEFDEALRPGAAAALQALRAEGVASPCSRAIAAARARPRRPASASTTCAAGATPEAKLAAVTSAQAAGQRVVMVGDGLNDAPVLARADVSFAIGQGALVSRSQADAVIASNQLADLVRARAHGAARCASCARTLPGRRPTTPPCVRWRWLGWLPPWAAGLGMAASSLVVVLNALRAAR